MFFYIFPYFVVYVYSLYIYITKTDDKIKIGDLLIVLIPALLVAVLRGNIGVDTANYSRFFLDKINQVSDSYTFEIGFEKIIDFLVFLNFNIYGIFAAIALIITVCLCISFSGSKSSALLFLLVFFPLFYVDSTMNALRYGLSFSISSLAIDFLYKKKYHYFIIVLAIAVSIQISTLLIFISFLIARFNWKLLLLFSLLITFYISDISQFILPYLIDKKEAYTFSYSPSRFSGILPLAVFLIIYILYIVYTKKSFLIPEIHIFLILETISFILAKYSYAGLRFQMLFVFCLILSIKNNFSLYKSKIFFLKSFFILSLLLYAIFIKNIITAESDLDSRYLPYEFFWNYK
jgi:hypothetical protein